MMMRFFLLFILLHTTSLFAQDFIYHMEPPNWWVDMRSNEFQLMIHGEKVGECEVAIENEDVKILKTKRLSNPNYLVLDLEILRSNKAFDFVLTFSKDGVVYENYKYKLLKKSTVRRETFNSSDVIYLITPDRFANGDPKNDQVKKLAEKKVNRKKPYARHGGDIQGIIDHLDYISDMGFTSIWSTPMLENNMEKGSYHGYAITDMYKVDPRMGTNELYKELSITARKKGIKIIKDVVLNHIGSNHWWMEDLPSEDWINNRGVYKQTTHRREALHDPYMVKSQIKDFVEGWFVETMPDLNQRNKILATYLIQNSLWWIEFAQLSGFRVDTYPYSDRNFLYRWNKAIQTEYPGFNIVGEEWTLDKSIIGLWQISGERKNGQSQGLLQKRDRSNVPSLMDFPLHDAIIKAMSPKEKKWDDRLLHIYRNLASDYLYPDPDNMVIFLDNHDMSRCFYQLKHDFDYWKMAHAFLLTTRGIPQVYYGTEILMSDSTNPGDHGTLRADFIGGWETDKLNAFEGKIAGKRKEAQEYLKNLLNWRKNCTPIHEGQLRHFPPTFENELYVMCRFDEERLVLLIMNNDGGKKQVKPSDYINQIKPSKNNHLGFDVIGKNEIDINEIIQIPSKSFLLMDLYF